MYEQRILDLEADVSKVVASKGPTATTLSSLQKDLEACRDQYKKKLADQQAVIDSLRDRLNKKERKDAGQLQNLNLFMVKS